MNKSKAIKVTIIGIILHYVIPFLKGFKIFEPHYLFKFGLISDSFYLTEYGNCFHVEFGTQVTQDIVKI